MPEGPQVHLVGLAHAKLFGDKCLRLDSPDGRSDDVCAAFDGARLLRVEVIGKHLFYVFGNDAFLHVHLGRFGRFETGRMPLPEVRGMLRLRMYAEPDWAELRGAVAIEALDAQGRARLEARLGPDPLNGDDPAAGFERIARSRSPIGGLLLDQSVLAGVGNIYRAETLFRLGLSPRCPGNRIDRTTFDRIWSDLGVLMGISMRSGGRIITTEAADRPSPRKKTVTRAEAHYVYRRAGRPCRRCGTLVEKGVIGARDCYWCPCCQPAPPAAAYGRRPARASVLAEASASA